MRPLLPRISRKSLLIALLGIAPFANAEESIKCNVAVVGGGAAGIHTAYQLSKLPPSNSLSDVCVFEKEDRLGGRIHDVALDPDQPSKVFGLGALRVMETQTHLFQLADELGIELVPAPFIDDLIQSRGETAFNTDDLNTRAYPLVTKDHLDEGGFGTEAALYDQLRFGPNRVNAALYPDFRSYVRDTLGTQGYQFLADSFRFRADFREFLSASAYLEYLDEEWDVCCTPYYPVGGMSRFITRMAEEASAKRVRIFTEDPVSKITRADAYSPYKLSTAKHRVTARHLVIAIPKDGLEHISGNIPDQIKAQPQYQDLSGIKVVTIAQRWPDAWWDNAGHAGRTIRRAWSTETCVNFIEIPTASYAADQRVTRSVYTDDPDCVKFWESTAQLGIAPVEAEIARGLAVMFPDASIPSPLNTVVKVWPAAWYWLKGGSTFSNADIATWAAKPLAGDPVSLVGEGWNPQRSGWSDGAYKSSLNALSRQFNVVPSTAASLVPRKVAGANHARP